MSTWPTRFELAVEQLKELGWDWNGDSWFFKEPDLRIPEDLRAQHLHHVEEIANEDALGLIQGDPKYGYSWKARGGVGAYMMTVRKSDRLDHSLSARPDENVSNLGHWLAKPIPPFDVFAALEYDTRPEGVIDDIRDLRRYLLLIEAEARARGFHHGTHRDNQNDPA